MKDQRFGTRLGDRLVDRLYREALQLSKSSRRYFETEGCTERDRLSPGAQVAYSSETLKVTTRLLHSLAWLLTQRAVMTGALSEKDALHPSRRLVAVPASETQVITRLPVPLLEVVRASEDLHRRVGRLDDAQIQSVPVANTVRLMQERLAIAL